ncbi:hypothetical protein ACWV95_29740 [Streptomyces albus]
MPDIETLLGQAVPAVGAAVSAYGAAVLTRAEDEAASATVRLGQQLLDRLLHRSEQPEALETAVMDVAETDGDPDALAALRLRMRQARRPLPNWRPRWPRCCRPRPEPAEAPSPWAAM